MTHDVTGNDVEGGRPPDGYNRSVIKSILAVPTKFGLLILVPILGLFSIFSIIDGIQKFREQKYVRGAIGVVGGLAGLSLIGRCIQIVYSLAAYGEEIVRGRDLNSPSLKCIQASPATGGVKAIESDGDGPESDEKLYSRALAAINECGFASASMFQSRLRISYYQADRIIDFMKAMRILGPEDASGYRQILVDIDSIDSNKVHLVSDQSDVIPKPPHGVSG